MRNDAGAMPVLNAQCPIAQCSTVIAHLIGL
jgi:hypothetical protein